MKRYALSLLFVMVLVPIGTRANIGENQAEVDARYGKTLGDVNTSGFGVMRGYSSPEYVIAVKLIDGASEMEMISKSNQSDMSASEIERWLKANGTGEWKAEPTGNPRWRRWRRADQDAVALYDAMRHFLYVSSTRFYDAQLGKAEGLEGAPNPAGQ